MQALLVVDVQNEFSPEGLRPVPNHAEALQTWDLLDHPHAVPTRVAAWFPPLCAAFDFVVALFVIFVH